MFTNGIGLNHQVAVQRHKDFLEDARKEHAIALAYDQNRLPRPNALANLRAALATTLFRAATWLMPVEHDRLPGQHAPHGLELHPGR